MGPDLGSSLFAVLQRYCYISIPNEIQSNLDISKLMGLFLTSSNYPRCKLICTSGNFGRVKKSVTPNNGWRKQSKCIFDSDRRFEFAEFKISEFEISRFDCISFIASDQRVSTGVPCHAECLLYFLPSHIKCYICSSYLDKTIRRETYR